jgi:hypothetical protein
MKSGETDRLSDQIRVETKKKMFRQQKKHVPRVLGGDLAELLHALRLTRVHARLQDVLHQLIPRLESDQTSRRTRRASGPETKTTTDGSDHRNGGCAHLVEVVALEQALVPDLGVACLLLAVPVGLLLLLRRRRLGCRGRHCRHLANPVLLFSLLLIWLLLLLYWPASSAEWLYSAVGREAGSFGGPCLPGRPRRVCVGRRAEAG